MKEEKKPAFSLEPKEKKDLKEIKSSLSEEKIICSENCGCKSSDECKPEYALNLFKKEDTIQNSKYSITDIEKAFCFGYLGNKDNDPLSNEDLLRRWGTFRNSLISSSLPQESTISVSEEIDIAVAVKRIVDDSENVEDLLGRLKSEGYRILKKTMP